MPGGNKQFFTIGGIGTKPDRDYRQTDPGKFTKAVRGVKPLLSNQTRMNKTLTDNKVRYLTEAEIILKELEFEKARKG